MAKTLSDAELVALAIPAGVALGTISKHGDALLAVFIFGLTVGTVDAGRARRLAEGGEALLREDPQAAREFQRFLEMTALMTQAALGE